jgi:hypothetical protein
MPFLWTTTDFTSIAKSVIIVARRRCSPGCRPRMDSTGGQPIGRMPSAKSAFAFSSLRFSNGKTAIDFRQLPLFAILSALSLVNLGSLSVIKMEEKNKPGVAEPLRICSARCPSDETLCVYCHFLVQCFCVSGPQEKRAWLEAADGTRHNAIIRPSLISMPTSREANWFFRMWI